MLRYVSRLKLADLVITGRDGGSIEDLWAFNDEDVARAIFECAIPVISAVGHEPDVTIADFVADVRAATPSNAAEIAVPDQEEIARLLHNMSLRANAAVSNRLRIYRTRLTEFQNRRVMKSPEGFLTERRMMLDILSERLQNAAYRALTKQKERFARSASMLDAMSPLKVLARGYAIATDENNRAVRNAGDVSDGERIFVRFERGSAKCLVEERMVE